MFQLTDEFLHIVLGVEAQSAHTCVEFDVYGESRDSFLLCRLDEGIEQAEGVHLRLQIVVEHGLEGCHLRVHNHDIAGDSVLAKGNALVGNGNGEIIHTMVLQGLGNLHSPSTIAVSLDHAHELGLGLHEGTVVVEVRHHGVEVHLQGGLVHLLHQEFGQLVEAKLAGTLQQDDLVAQGGKHLAADKLFHVREEELFRNLYLVVLLTEFRSDADKLHHAPLASQFTHLLVQFTRHLSALEDVAQYQGAATAPVVGTAVHEVEGDVEGVDVGVVTVVDKGTAVLSLLHLQPHGYGFEIHHPLVHVLGRQAQLHGYGSADDGVLHRSLVDEGDGIAVFLALIVIADDGHVALFLHTLHEEGSLSVLQ